MHKDDLEEMEEILQEGIKRKRFGDSKIKCACGSEMKVMLYEGYYDSFKQLKCSDGNSSF